MDRWKAFSWLCEALAPTIYGRRPEGLEPPPSWPLVVEAASYHLVTPALAWRLEREEGLAGEAASYFEAILELFRARNREMAGAIRAAAMQLARAGISAIALKGGASLIEELFPDPGIRPLTDIDLLVPEAQVAIAAAVLRDNGWFATTPDKPGHHHLAPLRHKDWPCTLELHRRVLNKRFGGMLVAEECFRNIRPLDRGDVKALLPSPTHRVVHNIVHSELVNRRSVTRVPELRQLLELCLLRERYEAVIDWEDVALRFRQAGQLPALQHNLSCARSLFGYPPPSFLSPASGCTTETLREAVERQKGLRRAKARKIARLVYRELSFSRGRLLLHKGGRAQLRINAARIWQGTGW
ncbi:MAG TPA: nucleotidyltransferase family protein [Allosphingosinicella sp.]|jgi:hypothetical protein